MPSTDPEEKDITLLRNGSNYLPDNMAKQPRTLESSF
jgi:hypothetical protein